MNDLMLDDNQQQVEHEEVTMTNISEMRESPLRGNETNSNTKMYQSAI